MVKVKSTEKIKCECCHRKFIPNRSDMVYCGKVCADRANKLKSRYKITPAAIYAIYKLQSGRCAICDIEGDIRELGFQAKVPMCIDHSHTSGNVRGLLCSNCNTGLGLLKDNRVILRQAIKYLTKHSGDRENEDA